MTSLKYLKYLDSDSKIVVNSPKSSRNMSWRIATSLVLTPSISPISSLYIVFLISISFLVDLIFYLWSSTMKLFAKIVSFLLLAFM